MIKTIQKHKVFNSTLDNGYLVYPKLSKEEERIIEAELFEQIMLFDRIVLKTGRVNFSLFFLIKKLGLSMVERLIDTKYIQFLLYSPMIVRSLGRQMENGQIDESIILGKPPIISGGLDIGKNYREETIDLALDKFTLTKKQKRYLKRKIIKNVILPDGMKSSKSTVKLIIDAYEGNLLEEIGLPFEKDSDQLTLKEREKLHGLSSNVLETSLLSKYGLKSFNQYDNFKLYNKNLENIGNALKVKNNAVEIFDLENIPNLKQLFLEENLSFHEAMKLRHGSTAKYFRNWLNTVSEKGDSIKISEEYIDEIKDKKGFFQTKSGKFIKTTSTFGLGLGIGTAIGNPLIGIPATYGLRLLDTFVLQDLIKGKNAKMFVDKVKNTVEK